MKGSRDLLLKFWDPLYNPRTVEARNFKSDRQIDHGNGKLGQEGQEGIT